MNASFSVIREESSKTDWESRRASRSASVASTTTGEIAMKGLIAVVAVGVLTAAGLGADASLAWPRFRGPDGSGVAEGQKPPVEFGPDKNVKWKVPCPAGLSSPIVAGDLLVVTAFEGDKL